MAGGAAGPAGSTGTSTGTTSTTGMAPQWNTGANWANPVAGTPWSNPTTGAPYMGVGSLSNTGAMTYQPPTSYSQMPTTYGDLNNPANAAGRRQQAIDQATQTSAQQTMNQQLPNSTGMGGYGYGPGYGGQGRFGYNPQATAMGYGGMGGGLEGIMGLLGALGFGGYGGYRPMGDRRFGPSSVRTDGAPTPATTTSAAGITSLT